MFLFMLLSCSCYFCSSVAFSPQLQPAHLYSKLFSLFFHIIVFLFCISLPSFPYSFPLTLCSTVLLLGILVDLSKDSYSIFMCGELTGSQPVEVSDSYRMLSASLTSVSRCGSKNVEAQGILWNYGR